MILYSHRDGNEVLFLALTKGGERVRRTGEGEQANRQERKREGGRETGEKIIIFLCVYQQLEALS